MVRLHPERRRAGAAAPGASPRYTLTPSIVLRNGEPFMAIGTPGGDNKEQTIIQRGEMKAAPYMKSPSPTGEGESRPRCRKDQLLVQRRTAILPVQLP